jgi:hypothetical protein
MTPRDFLDTHVKPNVADFHDRYDDVRLAYNAVASIDALAAHLYHWCVNNAPNELVGLKREDNGYRERLAGKHADFGLLRDIAKAQKHVRLTRGNPQVQSAAQMNARPIGWGEGGYGQGRFGGPPQVVVDRTVGGFSYVEEIVDSAVAFFEAEMVRLGL